MTRPDLFINALPPDAPKSKRESQKSSVRKAAAYHVHDARRRKSIAFEERKLHATRHTSVRSQTIKPRELKRSSTQWSGQRSAQLPGKIGLDPSQERAGRCSKTTRVDSGGQISQSCRTQAHGFHQKRALTPAWHPASEPEDRIPTTTSDQTLRQVQAISSLTRPGPSLFFSRWTADHKGIHSVLGPETVVSTLEAIDCFVNAVLPNNAPLYAMFEVSNHLVLPIMDELITDDSFREIWSSQMHNCRSLLAPSSRSLQSALMHKVAGMAMLRHDMEGSASGLNDYKLAAIALLAYMSSWDGDVVVADIHFSYLSRAVKERGGLDALGFDGWLKSTILQLDSLLALQSGFSRFQKYRAHKSPRDHTGRFVNDMSWPYDSLPSGFRTLARYGLLSLDTIETLIRIHELHLQASTSALEPKSPATWTSRRFQDFYDAFPCLLAPEVSLEKLLCATLVLYTVNEFSPQACARDIITAFVVPRGYVAKCLSKAVTTYNAERDCLVWIYAVLIDSYSMHQPDLLEQCRSLLTRWRQDFLKTVVRFFWPPRFVTSCRRMLTTMTDETEGEVNTR